MAQVDCPRLTWEPSCFLDLPPLRAAVVFQNTSPLLVRFSCCPAVLGQSVVMPFGNSSLWQNWVEKEAPDDGGGRGGQVKGLHGATAGSLQLNKPATGV